MAAATTTKTRTTRTPPAVTTTVKVELTLAGQQRYYDAYYQRQGGKAKWEKTTLLAHTSNDGNLYVLNEDCETEFKFAIKDLKKFIEAADKEYKLA